MRGLLVLLAFFVRDGGSQFQLAAGEVEAALAGRARLGVNILFDSFPVIIRQALDVF